MVEVGSFPPYMSSFCSCSSTFSDLYHLSIPNPSQCGIYFVAHSVSVSYRIVLGTLWGVERMKDSTVLWWQNDSVLGCA